MESISSVISKYISLLVSKDIILFGASEQGKQILNCLKEVSIEVDYFLDNNEQKWNTNFCGKPIKSPIECFSKRTANQIIIISSNYYDEICNQLNQNGLIKNKDYISFTHYPFEVGRHTYGHHQFIDNLKISSIGAFCSIGQKVVLAPTQHPTDLVSTHPFLYLKTFNLISSDNIDIMDKIHSKVTIKNDVWIGSNAIIMGGVTVGNGAIIGAGSIVTKDVPDYAIVVGVPAKILRYRYNKQQIEALNKIQWWNWSDEKIKENIAVFYDINELIKYANATI